MKSAYCLALGLDGYIRVSRVGGREGEGYISPGVQRDAVEAYARELGEKIVAWHDDQDFSGGSVERPGFQAALKRCREDQTGGIVVMRIDRFARSVADGAAVVRELVDAGLVFASCHERIDPRTPEGKFMLTSFLANAELFLDQARASWWTAKSRAIARGVHIGPTPIGYERAKSQPLSPHALYGPAISALFKRAAGGTHGDTALARWMHERAPREGPPWQPSEVRRWLRNRVYLGEVRYGELVNPEAHEPLTDPEIWEACQRESRTQRRAHSRFFLSGLVRCAACRYAMGGQTYGGAKQDTPVYRCTGRRICPEPSVITARLLDQFVIDAIRERLRGLVLEGVPDTADLSSLSGEARAAETELQAFANDLAARRTLGEGGWQEGLSLRAADRDAKKASLDEALAQTRMAAVALRVEEFGEHELRDALAMVRHVFVRRRPRDARALIVWVDDPPLDVPGPHRGGPFEPVRW